MNVNNFLYLSAIIENVLNNEEIKYLFYKRLEERVVEIALSVVARFHRISKTANFPISQLAFQRIEFFPVSMHRAQ